MKIISGGQTGVDRAALDFAIRLGLEHGGWCPRGRLAEDGPIAPRYRLRETESSDYGERTEKNALEADATLIIVRDEPLSGGTAFTRELAAERGRPVLVVCEKDGLRESVFRTAQFLKRHSVQTLNVAGPRESEAPGLGGFVSALLAAALSNLGSGRISS
ncbi:MAG: putative molybdenum carrier protein [Verrucomicrobiota bacterium]|nr:putative molybdenum carrier protein [Verrucomicrobiota bacterium]